MISYAPLWRTMEAKGITQSCLIRDHHVSGGQIDRMKKNMYVSTHTVNMFCVLLGCRVEDVMEYTGD